MSAMISDISEKVSLEVVSDVELMPLFGSHDIPLNIKLSIKRKVQIQIVHLVYLLVDFFL